MAMLILELENCCLLLDAAWSFELDLSLNDDDFVLLVNLFVLLLLVACIVLMVGCCLFGLELLLFDT